MTVFRVPSGFRGSDVRGQDLGIGVLGLFLSLYELMGAVFQTFWSNGQKPGATGWGVRTSDFRVNFCLW